VLPASWVLRRAEDLQTLDVRAPAARRGSLSA
jgi:hypothetical protein